MGTGGEYKETESIEDGDGFFRVQGSQRRRMKGMESRERSKE